MRELPAPIDAADAGRQRMTSDTPEEGPSTQLPIALLDVVRYWGRIGCTGFGGPPTHIALLRELCVKRNAWIDTQEFEDAVAFCNLLPGPASTQLSIFCAWRVRGRMGGFVGGVAFIVPGLVLILALAALFLEGAPPHAVLAAGAGAGAAVPAVALWAGWSLVPASRARTAPGGRPRWLFYLGAGAIAASTLGPWLIVALLLCGTAELVREGWNRGEPDLRSLALRPGLAAGTLGSSVLLSLVWAAFKVGALSYGGGFVIVPLMQADAVGHYHWMSGSQFLNAVALGQITPGPVLQTVAAVGYAAGGVSGGVLAAAVAFCPSFAFILLGGDRFQRVRADPRPRAFLNGAGPAAIGAILGSSIPLARSLAEPWQYGVLAGAGALLLIHRRGVVLTLLSAAAVGAIIGLAGGSIPR
jgi:chromate transporter